MIGDVERTLMTTIERRLVGHLRDAHALQEHAEAVLSEMLTAAAETAAVAAAMCEDAHAMSHELSDRWDLAVDMSLRAHGAGRSRPSAGGRS